MRYSPRELLVLEGDFAETPERVEGYALRGMSGWSALRDRVRTAPPSSIVLVRPGLSEGGTEGLRALVRGTPSIPVVAAAAFAHATASQVRALLDSGVAEVANAGEEVKLAALVPTLRRAHARPLKRRIEERMPVWVPEDARTLIRAAAQAVVDGGGREMFADVFGVYVRTVAAKCTELGLPPPRRLLGWVRVLLALTLLEEAHRTVLNVARCCGYTDNSSLKRAVENFAGSRVLSSIREQTFDRAFDGFADELRRLRHERRPTPGAAV